MQGQNYPLTKADLIADAPSIVALNPNRSMRTGDQPFSGARPVDLSVDTAYATAPRALYIGQAGVLQVDVLDIDGTTVLTNKSIIVQSGQVLPFACVRKVYSSANGTTAAGLWVGV
jgi:hypothetical protein